MEVARRDTGEKAFVPADQIVDHVQSLLTELQDGLFNAAKDRMTTRTREVNTWEEFTAGLEEGGFERPLGRHGRDGGADQEGDQGDHPLPAPRGDTTPGTCIRSGNPSARRVLFARAY